MAMMFLSSHRQAQVFCLWSFNANMKRFQLYTVETPYSVAVTMQEMQIYGNWIAIVLYNDKIILILYSILYNQYIYSKVFHEIFKKCNW